jgi:cyclohexyl-isocyanide hydratase
MNADPLSIGLLVFPRFTLLDLTGPYEVFSRIPGAALSLIGRDRAPVTCDTGWVVTPTTDISTSEDFDLLFVPGGPGQVEVMEDEEVLRFLRTKAERARYVSSVCTGSLVLAAAGLLTGYRATTHWLSIEILAALGADARRERVVVDRNRITGSGVAAGLDLALAVTAAIRGRETAEEIQLLIEYDPEPPFRSGSPRTADPALVAVVTERRRDLQRARLEQARRIVERRGR